MADLPLLSILLWLYPIGALLVWAQGDRGRARSLALAVNLLGVAASGAVLVAFDPGSAAFQLAERAAWIPSLNAHYALAVDGISVLFLPATTLLFLGVALASGKTQRPLQRLYYSLLLLQAGTTLGVFMAVDTLLFFLMWELSLVPFYFLVSLWGNGPHKGYAATKYTLIMFGGGVPLLFGILILAFNHASHTALGVPLGLSFDLPTLLHTPMPDHLEMAVFLLLLLGFAVKTPVFPLHTWLPLLAQEAPVAVVALLTGLKLGAYGLLRLAMPLAPGAAADLHWLLNGLGVVGLIYGAVAALAQTNLRAMLAYASLSHAGLVLLGLASLTQQGAQGALMMLLNFTLVAGGLFLATTFLYQRVGSTDVTALGGAAGPMPLLAGFTLFLGMASLGLPLTAGFPAELLILGATFDIDPGTGLAALFAMVLGGGYFLNLYRQAFFGPVTQPAVAQAQDLLPRERLILGVFAIAVLVMGLFPGPLLNLIQPSTAAWVARFI